jgi:hypothetical protein
MDNNLTNQPECRSRPHVIPLELHLTSQLPADTTRLVRLPGARHTIFRDRPDLAFPAVKNFVSQISESQHAS